MVINSTIHLIYNAKKKKLQVFIVNLNYNCLIFLIILIINKN